MFFTFRNMIVFTTRSMKFLHTITNGMLNSPHSPGRGSAAVAGGEEGRGPEGGRRGRERGTATAGRSGGGEGIGETG